MTEFPNAPEITAIAGILGLWVIAGLLVLAAWRRGVPRDDTDEQRGQ